MVDNNGRETGITCTPKKCSESVAVYKRKVSVAFFSYKAPDIDGVLIKSRKYLLFLLSSKIWILSGSKLLIPSVFDFQYSTAWKFCRRNFCG